MTSLWKKETLFIMITQYFIKLSQNQIFIQLEVFPPHLKNATNFEES